MDVTQSGSGESCIPFGLCRAPVVEAGSGFILSGSLHPGMKLNVCFALQPSQAFSLQERLCLGHREFSLPTLFLLFLLTLMKDKTSCGGLASVVWKSFEPGLIWQVFPWLWQAGCLYCDW